MRAPGVQAPCYMCPDRYEVCWSSCEKYKAFRAAKDEERKKRYEEFKADCIYFDGIRKMINNNEGARKWR